MTMEFDNTYPTVSFGNNDVAIISLRVNRSQTVYTVYTLMYTLWQIVHL